jgi:hypothetical protein
MVLRDLFRPRWQHSNPVVRRAAVTKLVDQALLAEIAKNDVHRGVRIAAAEKLSDQKVLLSVATGNDLLEVRMAAAKRLTDETIAARVLADLEKDFQTREQAANAFRELAEFRQDHAVKLPARK